MRHVLLVATLCAGALASAGAVTAKTPLPGIRSPSGNIRCVVLPGSPSSPLLCSIAHSSYGAALQARCLRPDGSGVDWHGFALTPDRGAVNCSGGILYSPKRYVPRYVSLPYGRTWHRGVFTCTSRVTGLTCRNRRGHGLFLSRESWRVW